MWDSISPPWQAALELVWEAYCDDCIPIAAVITDPDGDILATGRNRIRGKPSHHLGVHAGNRLAHAEVEALNKLDYASIDPHSCVLYTTTEPCPMCLGAFYMSGLRTLHFASRDPYAGSTNLLGTSPYLSIKKIKVHKPHSPVLEKILMALYIEKELHDLQGNGNGQVVLQTWEREIPQVVVFGRKLYQSGELRNIRSAGSSVREVIDRLAYQVQ